MTPEGLEPEIRVEMDGIDVVSSQFGDFDEADVDSQDLDKSALEREKTRLEMRNKWRAQELAVQRAADVSNKYLR